MPLRACLGHVQVAVAAWSAGRVTHPRVESLRLSRVCPLRSMSEMERYPADDGVNDGDCYPDSGVWACTQIGATGDKPSLLVRLAVQAWLRRESTVRRLKRCIIQRLAVAPKGMDSLHFCGPPLARRTDVGIKPA